MTEEIINTDGSRNWEANILLDNIKRLEQENKELQAYKDVNEDFKKAWDELNEKYKQLRSALEEIRDINKLFFERKYGYPEDLIKIDNIINEVLNDN